MAWGNDDYLEVDEGTLEGRVWSYDEQRYVFSRKFSSKAEAENWARKNNYRFVWASINPDSRRNKAMPDNVADTTVTDPAAGTADPLADEPGEEKYSAQVLRRIHEDASILLQEYHEMRGPLEHEGIDKHMESKLEALVSEIEEIESLFQEHHPELHESAPLGGGSKDMDDGDEAEAAEVEDAETETEADSDEEELPTPDEAIEGMETADEDENKKSLKASRSKTISRNGKAWHKDCKGGKDCKCAKCAKSLPGRKALTDAAGDPFRVGDRLWTYDGNLGRVVRIYGNYCDVQTETGGLKTKIRLDHIVYLGDGQYEQQQYEKALTDDEVEKVKDKIDKEAADTEKKGLKVGKKADVCQTCEGTGSVKNRPCPQCGGSGVSKGMKKKDFPEDEEDERDIGGEGKKDFPNQDEDIAEGTLKPHELEHVNGAKAFLKSLGTVEAFGDDHRLDAHHHGSNLEKIAGMEVGQKFAPAAAAAAGGEMAAVTEALNVAGAAQQLSNDKSMQHPHRKACGMAGKYLKALGKTHDFGMNHQEEALTHLKALEGIGPEDEATDKEEGMDQEDAPVPEPGEMGEKAMVRANNGQNDYGPWRESDDPDVPSWVQQLVDEQEIEEGKTSGKVQQGGSIWSWKKSMDASSKTYQDRLIYKEYEASMKAQGQTPISYNDWLDIPKDQRPGAGSKSINRLKALFENQQKQTKELTARLAALNARLI